MDFSRYVIDAAGHASQIIPPILLYFLCVPEERYRFSKRKTVGYFCAGTVLLILVTSAVKFIILRQYPEIRPNYITLGLLVVDFGLMMLVTKRLAFVHAGPNRVIILLGLFATSMHYTISGLILISHIHADTYDLMTILVYSVVTAILFPLMKHLMVPYAREYLLTRDRVRPQVKIIVSVMAVISLVQIYAVSRHTNDLELPLLALMSLCVSGIYMLLIRYVAVEEQRARIELHLLSSQIRPHFICNTLNTIANLVDEDQDATLRAIYDLSGYLRMNVEALERNEPVRFEEELEHAKFYLSIEKLRFREELEIEIDTPVTDFELPALTVQPIVENAVRHGLRAKEGKGKLWLSTGENDHAYEVVIRDDGVGFQQSIGEEKALRLNGEGHYGIVNVRARLKRMVRGDLIIESETGKGTTVIIQIPKRTGRIKTGENI
ncbi:MAG: histidine kinase [Lachnospiraceae bacterium]|nr:histidine kinase [Lachnospiraceae bacterium]